MADDDWRLTATLHDAGHVRRAVRLLCEQDIAGQVRRRLGHRVAVSADGVDALSGGNQQKLLIARMLLCQLRVLIADEPTRGVDVGAKRAIHELLTALTADGVGVLLISSDLNQ